MFDDDSVVVDFLSIQAAANLSLLDVRKTTPLQWIFDCQKLESVIFTTGDRNLSVLRSVIDNLGRIGEEIDANEAYVDTLRHFTTHPFHIIRWAAIQAISAMDFEQAKPLILRSLNDEHSDIRSVAERLTKRFSLI